MSDKKTPEAKKTYSPDWLVSGILTKIGEIFDRLTGRKWKPSSSLATSELIVRLRKLLDSEVRDTGDKGCFVPHNIKLKMQWNKFSTDAEDALKKLEYELLTAAIDHINDKRYHTNKPLNIEVKPDYFTEGVKFLASFGEFDDEEVEINVTVPQLDVKNIVPEETGNEPEGEVFIAEFSVGGKPKSVRLKFTGGKRVSVGRTRENDLSIEEGSVSKVHATLILNAERQLLVADTGSTNGTFINNQRIAYGRSFPVGESDKLKFGTVEVFLRRVPQETDFQTTRIYETTNLSAGNYQAALQLPQNYEADKPINEFVTSTNSVAVNQFDKTISLMDSEKEDNRDDENAGKTEEPAKLNFDKDG